MTARRSRAARVVAVCCVVALAAVVLLTALPGGGGTAGRTPVAQAISFRLAAAGGLAVLAAVAAAVALRRPAGRSRHLALAVTGVLLAGALGHTAVLAARGWSGVGPVAAAASATEHGALTVLAFNTFDSVPPADLAAMVLRTGATVVSLPETSPDTARRTADLLAAEGMPMQALTGRAAVSGTQTTSLLVAESLGGYRIVESRDDKSLVAAPERAGSPVLVAVHTQPPLGGATMPRWREDIAWAVSTCQANPTAVVAGDFNATLDHPAMRRLGDCTDAAAAVNGAALGTWPAVVPSVLSAPIDHVLLGAQAGRVLAWSVLEAHPDSDHRPVLATIATG